MTRSGLDAGGLVSWTPLIVMVGAFAAVVVVLAVLGRRSGATGVMLWVPRGLTRATGIPGWAAAMVGTASFGLLVAGVGFYNDVAWHVGLGRDEELFTAPHAMIVIGLLLIVVAALVGIVSATWERWPGGLRVLGLRVPRSAAAMLLVGLVAVAGFPLDELWHSQFGIDVTMWSPTHLLMIVGASLTPVVSWLALAESGVRPQDSGRIRAVHIVVGLMLLDGLSSVQGEFDFGVPQFQALYAPVLVLLAGALAMVAVRVAHGPGWSLLVVGLMLMTRVGLGEDAGVLQLSVRPSAIYLGSAVAVELVAYVAGTQRRARFGLLAGSAVATLGLAVEWWWSQGAAQPWRAPMLPEALLVGGAAALAAGVIGVALGDVARRQPIGVSSRALGAAGVVVLVVLALPYPRTVGDVTADIRFEGRGADAAEVVVALTPADAADDARWFQASAWQGGGLVLADMVEVSPGTWRSEHVVPLAAPWKTLLRLHRGSEMMAIPLYLPADDEIDGPRGAEVRVAGRTAVFEKESRYLLREQTGGSAFFAWVVPALVLGAAGAALASFVWVARHVPVGGPARGRDEKRERVPADLLI